MRLLMCVLTFLFSSVLYAGEVSKRSIPLSELKTNLSFKVYVPRFIAPGFKLSNVKVISEKGESDRFSPNYELKYCNLKNDCYLFESAGEFGDPPETTKQASGGHVPRLVEI
jgi:hypothetical protein